MLLTHILHNIRWEEGLRTVVPLLILVFEYFRRFQMGRMFRRANRQETVRYTTPDGEDFIELRSELSKGEVNEILRHAPRGDADVDAGLDFISTFFEKTVVSWSATDEEGNPIPPTVEEYQNLEAGAGQWIDKQLGQHLNKVIGQEVDELEGKPLN